MEIVQKWRKALARVATISGWDSKEWVEANLVEEISKEILKKLSHVLSNDYSGLVGTHRRIWELRSLLCTESKEVRIIGIWGMGGIGKTTIARAIYSEIADNFEAHCFVEFVREESKRDKFYLQKQLLSKILKTRRGDIEDLDSFSLASLVKRQLRNRSVLVVLDDVDDTEHVELILDRCFGEGSRVIVTTRNKEVLDELKAEIYEERGLIDDESLELFSIRAFKRSTPCKDFVELSQMVINYTGGNPLALRVIGSSLYGKARDHWECALERLKLIPNRKVFDVLKISFDSLLDEEKEVFLHAACFFKGKQINTAEEILRICGYHPRSVFTTLIDRCLMDYSPMELQMHDLIQEMGWEIVRRQSIDEPGKRSRLWMYQDVYHVLSTNTGTKWIKGIAFDPCGVNNALCINPSSFSNMHGVKLLIFGNVNILQGSCKGLRDLPRALKYMFWHAYPFNCLPLGLYIKDLVVIEMPESHIEKLWKKTQHPVQLKVLNLRHSKCLTSIPDLSGTTNLESLILNDCTSLVEIHSSVSCLKKLKVLDVKGCTQLESFPACISSDSLETFILSGCQKLKKFPEISCKIEHLLELPLDETGIEEIPSSIDNLKGLVTLSMKNCKMIKHLPNSICNFSDLKNLVLSGCTQLESLPENISNIKSLETLEVGGTAITGLPCIEGLNNLTALSLAGCRRIERWHLSLPLHCLEDLNLSDCNLMGLPTGIDCLSQLNVLNLSGNKFRSLPESIKQLYSLKYLYLARCGEIKSLPLLPPGILHVDASNCWSLELISQPLLASSPGDYFRWNKKVAFILFNCPRLAWYEEGSFMLESVKNFQDIPQLQSESCVEQLTSSPQNLPEMKTWSSLSPQEKRNSFLRQSQLIFCVPGDDVPSWFSHRSLGGEVTIDLPHINFLTDFSTGFALCAIRDFESSFSLFVCCRCNIITTNYSKKFVGNILSWANRGSGKWEGNYMLLAYVLSWCLLSGTEDWCPEEAIGVVFTFYGVKSCGVHLIDLSHGADDMSLGRYLATTSAPSNAETGDITLSSQDFITLFGSKMKRPRDGPGCSILEISSDDSDKEPPAK